MIQANELRIGNWVDHFGNYGQMETIKKDGVIFLVYGKLKQGDFGNVIEALEPITLTPEILEKCGFEFGIKLQDFVKGRHQFVEIKNMIDGYFSEDGFFYYGLRTKIHYLHQLQNLYFALTGEELTFKP